MKIRVATLEDIGLLMGIIRGCIEHLNAQDIYQWDETYPTDQHFIMTIKK